MNVFELYGSLGLNTSTFIQGLSDTKNKFQNFASELSSGMNGIKNVISPIAGAVKSLDDAITTVFDTTVSTVVSGIGKMTSAVAGFTESFMQTGLSFDSSISQVSATLLKTQDEFNETKVTIDGFSGSLRDLALEMGSSTKFTATQAGEALNYMALAGYDAQTSAEMLPKVLNLASASAMDLGAASDMITDAQTALGLSIEDTTNLIDQMAKTASSSNTSVSQLGDAILSIGATGRQLKGGYTELNTVLGVLADNGIKASEGGNDLRRMLVRLSSPSKEGATALEKLGVSVYDAQGKIKAMPDLFLELNNAMSGLTEEGKNNAVSDIFGQYALAGANALLNTSAERWKELKEKIVDSEGAAKDMADIQLDNLQGKLTIMKSALEGLQISFSDLFSGKAQEYVETFSNGLADITTQIREGDFKGAFFALGRTAVDLINQGADDILSSQDEANTFVEGFISFVKRVANTVINRGSEVLPALTDFFTNAGQKAIDALFEIVNDPEQFGKITGTINLVLTKIQTFLDENEDKLYTIFDKLFNAGIGIFQKVFVMRRKTIGNILIRKFSELFDDYKAEFKRIIIDRAAEGWLNFGESLKEFMSELPYKWEENFQPLGEKIWESIDLTGKRIKKWWGKEKVQIVAIKDWFLNGWSEFANSWTEKVNTAKEYVTEAINTVRTAITDIVDKAKKWGTDLIENFVQGIVDMKDKLGEKAGEIAETISSFLHFSLPEKGPLATSDEWMPDFMNNLAQGIEKNRGLVQGAIKNVAEDIKINGTLNAFDVNGDSVNRRNSPITVIFNIQNVNGVSERDAHSFALNVADELSDIIFRDKVVRA